MVLALVILIIFFSLGIYFFKKINNDIKINKNELKILIKKFDNNATKLIIKLNNQNIEKIDSIINEKFTKIKLEKIKELQNTILKENQKDLINNKKLITTSFINLEKTMKNNIHNEHKKVLAKELKKLYEDMDKNLNNVIESVKNLKVY